MAEVVQLEDHEQHALEQLQAYKRLFTRIQVLETYPVAGGGILLSTIAEDDRLQELHNKLRGLPSYMYLSKRDLKLEETANAYLTRYPAGTKAQLNEVKSRIPVNEEDEKLLKELAGKIQKVIDTRGGGPVDDFEALFERISELQELEDQRSYFESTLNTLEAYKPKYGQILRLQFVKFMEPLDIAEELGVSVPTLYKWRKSAVREYGKLIKELTPIKS